ncbi:ABC transporter ATP-binding protein [Microbacterium luticocti]|uniref:ABC transporter ATP-binding protein n=1 Tax=Microbacterium luticocti TaxID=451764 RepID=UPI0003F61F0C|nr:ABC transporter ATP-binding protein [Microbacterium luticocti]
MTTVQIDDAVVVFESKSERIVALDQISLSVTAGTVATVFGASGSGKSTLLGVAAGLQTLDSGRVRVAETDITTASEEARARVRLHHVGVVFQESNLIPEFTALENITLPLRARGLAADAARAQAAAWLARVGLEGLGKRRPSELSGGQRQRVGIARALAGDREILVADEPTGALDSENSEQIFALLRSLADDGRAILIASHDERSLAAADDMYRMSDGRIVEHRTRVMA